MRSVNYREFLASTGLTIDRLKVLRQRQHLALAFGRAEAYESLGYLEVDAVAVRLTEVLAEKLDRTLATNIVLGQWGVYLRVIAVAEATPGPVFLYVIGYEDSKRRTGWLTVGSKLDSRSDDNLRSIAEDLQKREGVICKNYVVVEMQSILEDVRHNAKKAGYDFSAPFLPGYGSPELEEILKPFDYAMPDRAIVVTDTAKQSAAEKARRAGIVSRATVEASIPAIPRGRVQ